MVNYEELFEKYFQKKYDFDTNALSQEQVEDIKALVREKRADYALAPMGTDIFDWILKQSKELRFELIPFDSERIDGMLYIPNARRNRAYIVLNANRPLINQIFAAAHEYYHYLRDYQKLREKPFICDLSALRDVNEKMASRFAAELLLPEEALRSELRRYCAAVKHGKPETMDFDDFAVLSILLTIRYQLPLKAVFYRLKEEGYINELDKYIDNYDFIKKALQEIEITKKRAEELYGTENKYVIPYGSTYADMENAFEAGTATREAILRDAEKLQMDMSVVHAFLEQESDEPEDDDEELF